MTVFDNVCEITCAHCRRPSREHAKPDMKCLFAATTFVPMMWTSVSEPWDFTLPNSFDVYLRVIRAGWENDD